MLIQDALFSHVVVTVSRNHNFCTNYGDLRVCLRDSHYYISSLQFSHFSSDFLRGNFDVQLQLQNYAGSNSTYARL